MIVTHVAVELQPRVIASSLMKNALALLDHAGAREAAAALQGAIDILNEEPVIETAAEAGD